jgi:hypothetical protein
VDVRACSICAPCGCGLACARAGLAKAEPGADAGPAGDRGTDADPVLAQQLGGGTAAVRRGLKIVAAATEVGLLTGFFGVGGGFVIVPAPALGVEMPVAAGTSLLIIARGSRRLDPQA